jgi:hypothetical protein
VGDEANDLAQYKSMGKSFRVFKPVGGEGGLPFNDLSYLRVGVLLTKIVIIQSVNWIENIQLEYSNGLRVIHGQKPALDVAKYQSNQYSVLNLNPAKRERIIYFYVEWSKTKDVVPGVFPTGIYFSTSERQTLWKTVQGSIVASLDLVSSASFEPPHPGWGLAGFFGKHGWGVDRIGPIWMDYSAQA